MKQIFLNQTYKSIKFLMLMCLVFCYSCSTELESEIKEEAIETGKIPILAKNGEITPVSVSANGDDGNVPQNTLD